MGSSFSVPDSHLQTPSGGRVLRIRSPFRCGLFLGVALLISPAFCVSMLLLGIVTLPLWIAAVIYLIIADDMLLLAGVERDPDEDILFSDEMMWEAKLGLVESKQRGLDIDEQRNPNNLEPRNSGISTPTIAGKSTSRRSSIDCHAGSDTQTWTKTRSPTLKAPFDLTDHNFSPHWSFREPVKQRSPIPSSLKCTSAGSVYSPQRWPSPATPATTERPRSPDSITESITDNENFSPIKLAPEERVWEQDTKIPSMLKFPPHMAAFSTELPEALRSYKDQGYNSTDASFSVNSSPSIAGDEEAFNYAAGIGTRDLPVAKKKALIKKYKTMIFELEESMQQSRDSSIELDDCPVKAPLFTSIRPSVVPRNRGMEALTVDSNGEAADKENFKLAVGATSGRNFSGEFHPVRSYGQDEAHWTGWDGACEVSEKALDTPDEGRLTDDMFTEVWRQKWAVKGVKVLMPVDEESNESASSKHSPPSKVHWTGPSQPSPPVSEAIPPSELQGPLFEERPQYESHVSASNGAENRSLYEPEPRRMIVSTSSTPLFTMSYEGESDSKLPIPVNPASRSLRNSIRTAFKLPAAIGSPSITPPLPPGKQRNLIRMFEELSKAPPEARSAIMSPTSRSLASSPEHFGAASPSAMLNTMKMQLDGPMDAAIDGAGDVVPKIGGEVRGPNSVEDTYF